MNQTNFSSDKSMICAGGEDKDACQVLFQSFHQNHNNHHYEQGTSGRPLVYELI